MIACHKGYHVIINLLIEAEAKVELLSNVIFMIMRERGEYLRLGERSWNSPTADKDVWPRFRKGEAAREISM